ncbi:MAG: HIT family protein [Candidatus Babeliales bacterium]|nr:HIT family protein [Candidatus Babeliales bacterium]
MRCNSLILANLICLSLHSSEVGTLITHNLENLSQQDSPRYKEKCPFCNPEKCKMTKYKESENCYAIKDINPVSPGHVLIIPKQHYKHWFKTPPNILLEMINLMNEVKVAIDEEYIDTQSDLHQNVAKYRYEDFDAQQPAGYTIGANCETAGGQSVMHTHLHFIPRIEGDTADPQGGVRGCIPERQHLSGKK